MLPGIESATMDLVSSSREITGIFRRICKLTKLRWSISVLLLTIGIASDNLCCVSNYLIFESMRAIGTFLKVGFLRPYEFS